METKTVNNLDTQEKRRVLVISEKQDFVDQRMEEIVARCSILECF